MNVRFPVYASDHGLRLSRRTSYDFAKAPGRFLAGWIVAPHGSTVEYQRDVRVLFVREPHALDSGPRALTPHMARTYAMNGKYGLRWIGEGGT